MSSLNETQQTDNSKPMPETGRPVLVVVDDQDTSRSNVTNSLRRRFGPDYEILEFRSPSTAHNELEHLRDKNVDVALIAANMALDGKTGTRFLGSTRELFPTARRLVLVSFGDNWVMQEVSRSAILGEVDHCDYLPWGENDEHFLAAVGDILADWATEN